MTVGRVNPNKRVAEVIHSIASSPFLRARCEYHIVGDINATEKVRLQSLIDQLDLQEVVQLHGAVSDFELRWRYASYTEPSKAISKLLRESPSPAESRRPGSGALPPLSESSFFSPSVISRSEGEEPRSELPSHSVNGSSDTQLGFSSEGEQHDGQLRPHSAKTPIVASMRRFVGRCTVAILGRAKRYSLRHFLFRCAEPILSLWAVLKQHES
jgi:Glycosyl transferases group 1